MEQNEPIKPVESVSFWRDRIYRTLATGGMLHQIIYDNSYDVWQYVQAATADILKGYVKPGEWVLDAGCGYGALLSAFEEAKLLVNYKGVDLSPDLIELARYRYPRYVFFVNDLRKLPFKDGEFEWVVYRSVEGMICDNVGIDHWLTMLDEGMRVGKNVMLLDYPKAVDDSFTCEIVTPGSKNHGLLIPWRLRRIAKIKSELLDSPKGITPGGLVLPYRPDITSNPVLSERDKRRLVQGGHVIRKR